MDEKLKSENMQKTADFCVYVILWEQSGQSGVENGAMLTHFIYSDILQNALFCSQIFKSFFPSSGKGALTPNQNPADVPEYKHDVLGQLLVFLSDIAVLLY